MSNSANFKIDTRGIVNAVGDEDVATGDLKFWPSETIPAGWLVRDGRALSRVAYAQLFAVLGTRYGAGDGATTFNIPDDRAEFIRGADMGRGVDAGRAVGSTQSGSRHVAYTYGSDGQGRAGAWWSDYLRDDSVSGGMEGLTTVDGTVAGGNGHNIADNSFAGNGAHTMIVSGTSRPRNRAYVPLIKY